MFIVSCTICIIISTSVTQSTSLFIESKNQIPVYGSIPNYPNNIIPKTTHINKSIEWNSFIRSNNKNPNYKAFSLPGKPLDSPYISGEPLRTPLSR